MRAHTPLSIMLTSTREHRMTVLRDDGLYRHLRFARPGTGIWRFDLVTWPGHLVITGDLEDFHFARIDDMFQFFRHPVGYINESYWAEKLCGPVRNQAKTYSTDVLKRRVYDAFRWGTESRRGPHAPLWRKICDEVLSDDVAGSQDTARLALRDFRYRDESQNGEVQTFEFYDSWEWDLTEYDWHFQVSCHAIVWGIKQYDRARQAAAS